MQAIYTWSESLDNKSAAAVIGYAVAGWNGFMDNHHPNLDYGLSDFDVGSRFVANYLYQWPVGRGHQDQARSYKAADAVVDGWRLGGIVSVQGGLPCYVYGQDPFGLSDVIFGFGIRADRVPNE